MGERRIVCGDAFEWLAENPASAGTSIVTSLPDASELPKLSFDAWRAWFVETARTLIRWLPTDGVAIFYQTDLRRRGVWIDKGYLVMRAAEEEGASVCFHKIVCRAPAGTIAAERPTYSHMIGVAREARNFPQNPGPDVLPDAGASSWTRGMGIGACALACAYLRDNTETRLIVDPFCGRGTLIAVADSMGFATIGVELSAQRCRAARTLVVPGVVP